MSATYKPSRLSLSCAVALILIAASTKSARAGMVMFEDSWPDQGDRDFNDQVISYNYAETTNSSGDVTGLRATYNVLAVGATLHNGLYLHLPLPSSNILTSTVDLGHGAASIQPVSDEKELVIPLVDDTRSLFPASVGSGPINTIPGSPLSTASTITLDLQFATPADLSTTAAPFDLFIARSDDFTHQIHLPQYPGTDHMDTGLFNSGADSSATSAGLHFINTAGLPFALNIPSVIAWPQEHVELDQAYPDIDNFAATGGTSNTDWYSTDVNSQFLFSSVPEPSSLLLMTIAGSAMCTRRRAR